MSRKTLITILFALSVGLSGALVAAQGHVSVERSGGGGGDGGRGFGGGGRGYSGGGRYGGSGGWGGRGIRPSVVIKMRQYNVPRPDYIRNPNHFVRDSNHISWPQRDGRGALIGTRAATVAPQQHASVVRNPAVISDIQQHARIERDPNRYYWHDIGGIRYCHYFDRGIHWYGFYHGPTFYWTRYYGDRWWWFDVNFDRWVYWWDGYWWWPSPAGLVYVYVDNNYYPYENGTVVVTRPEVQAPAQSAPTPNSGTNWTSPDNRRMIQVYGPRAEAFLYDQSSGQPAFMKFLGQGIEKVRFSGGKNGKPLRILVDFQDGNFALFDEDGEPLDAAAAASEPPAAAPPPMSPPPGAPPNK